MYDSLTIKRKGPLRCSQFRHSSAMFLKRSRPAEQTESNKYVSSSKLEDFKRVMEIKVFSNYNGEIAPMFPFKRVFGKSLRIENKFAL
jgi:hypothetical protein